jgi:hypothetical protein
MATYTDNDLLGLKVSRTPVPGRAGGAGIGGTRTSTGMLPRSVARDVETVVLVEEGVGMREDLV